MPLIATQGGGIVAPSLSRRVARKAAPKAKATPKPAPIARRTTVAIVSGTKKRVAPPAARPAAAAPLLAFDKRATLAKTAVSRQAATTLAKHPPKYGSTIYDRPPRKGSTLQKRATKPKAKSSGTKAPTHSITKGVIGSGTHAAGAPSTSSPAPDAAYGGGGVDWLRLIELGALAAGVILLVVYMSRSRKGRGR